MKCDIQVRQLRTQIAYRYSCREGRLHQAAMNRKQIYTGENNNVDLHTWILLPTYIISREFKVAVEMNMQSTLFVDITKVIQKVSTVCAYLSRILQTVPLHMCSDFLYQLRSHRCNFVKFVLSLCLFLCLKHV